MCQSLKILLLWFNEGSGWWSWNFITDFLDVTNWYIDIALISHLWRLSRVLLIKILFSFILHIAIAWIGSKRNCVERLLWHLQFRTTDSILSYCIIIMCFLRLCGNFRRHCKSSRLEAVILLEVWVGLLLLRPLQIESVNLTVALFFHHMVVVWLSALSVAAVLEQVLGVLFRRHAQRVLSCHDEFGI